MRSPLISLFVGTVLLATGCGAEPPGAASAAASTPSPSAQDKVTGDDALAALAASTAARWGTGREALGPRPATPAGFSDETAQQAYEYAVEWVGFGMDFELLHGGSTTFWEDVVDADRSMGLHEDLSGGKAALWVNAFVRSVRLLEPPRVKGAFTERTVRQDGQPKLRLTWRGTVIYPVESIDGYGSLQPVFREVTWSWSEDGRMGVSTYAHFGNVDLCVIAGTGLVKPARGDIDLPAEYLEPESYKAGSTEQEQADQKARIAAC